jgi:hypothetical protein
VKLLIIIIIIIGQVDQQDIPITGQPTQSTDEVRDKTKTKKEGKRSNHQIVIKNQQNFHSTHTKQQASCCRSLMRGLR